MKWCFRFINILKSKKKFFRHKVSYTYYILNVNVSSTHKRMIDPMDLKQSQVMSWDRKKKKNPFQNNILFPHYQCLLHIDSQETKKNFLIFNLLCIIIFFCHRFNSFQWFCIKNLNCCKSFNRQLSESRNILSHFTYISTRKIIYVYESPSGMNWFYIFQFWKIMYSIFDRIISWNNCRRYGSAVKNIKSNLVMIKN